MRFVENAYNYTDTHRSRWFYQSTTEKKRKKKTQLSLPNLKPQTSGSGDHSVIHKKQVEKEQKFLMYQ